jgi:hypothetical protein
MRPPPQPRDHARPSATGALAYLTLGPIIWAVQLTVVYGGHTLLCDAGAPPASSVTLVAATTAAAVLAVLAALLFRPALARRAGLGPDTSGRRTLEALARLLDLLSLIAIVWSGSAAAVLQACAAAR